MNWWYAECLPCSWETTHATEDAAIFAAETHIYGSHPELFSMPSNERSLLQVEKKIGHVQLRADTDLGPPGEPIVTDPELGV